MTETVDAIVSALKNIIKKQKKKSILFPKRITGLKRNLKLGRCRNDDDRQSIQVEFVRRRTKMAVLSRIQTVKTVTLAGIIR